MTRTKMANHSKGQQKYPAGNRGQRNQPHINHTVDLLAVAALFASSKMAFVIAAHLQRQAGNVIPPARQNLSNDRINALLAHKELQKPDLGAKSKVWDF